MGSQVIVLVLRACVVVISEWEEYDQQLFNIYSLTFDMDISKSSGYKDFVQTVKIYRLSLELIGLWPKIDGVANRIFSSDIRMGFTFIVLLFIYIPILCEFTYIWSDMELVIDNLRISIPFLIVFLKLIILRWKQSVISSVINMIKEDWMTVSLDAERNVMMKYMHISNLIVISAQILAISIFTGLVVFPCFGLSFRHQKNVTRHEKILPLQTDYFYDTDKSPQYEITYFIHVIGTFQIMITYTSVLTLLGFMIYHICGQLENFRHRLVNLVGGEGFNKALSNNVVTHLRLIRYFNNIEDIFTLMMFFSIIYFAVAFCLAGFMLLIVIKGGKINVENVSELYYMIIVVIAFFVEMLFYCYVGELLTEQCETIYRTVYDLEWYKWDSRQARNLIILLVRIQEPFRITAGKIVPLTMTTFCSLVKTSAGYISFLLTMQH